MHAGRGRHMTEAIASCASSTTTLRQSGIERRTTQDGGKYRSTAVAKLTNLGSAFLLPLPDLTVQLGPRCQALRRCEGEVKSEI